jgi:hypothetical protein
VAAMRDTPSSCAASVNDTPRHTLSNNSRRADFEN